jgi:hypothetical protein
LPVKVSVPLTVELPVIAAPPEETVNVVKVGAVPNTKLPDPVSSVMELIKTDDKAEEVRLEEPSVNTAREAVRPERVIVPDEVILVAPVIAPAPEISRLALSSTVSQFEPTAMAVSVALVPAASPSILIP